jgi:hypothetical protein
MFTKLYSIKKWLVYVVSFKNLVIICIRIVRNSEQRNKYVILYTISSALLYTKINII